MIIENTKALKEWRGEYDFAVDGGGTGAIVLRSNDGSIPAGAVIFEGFLDVVTACLSATGTMAIAAESAADMLAATAQAGLTLGRKSIIPASTGATAVKTTAARNPTLTIATAAFTAGKMFVTLLYR